MTKKELWGSDNTALIALAEKYECTYDSDRLNRKELIPAIWEKMEAAGDTGRELKNVQPKPWVLIRFHTQQDQPKYVTLGHNGDVLYLPREVPVKIPAKFMETVRVAVREDLRMQTLQNGKIRWAVHKVPTLSYEVLERGED